MTGNLGMVENLHHYLGNDVVLIGDGSLHEIIHIGGTFIGFGDSWIKLKDVLFVLDLAKNLLYISQLMYDYHFRWEFYSVGFSINEKATDHTMLNGWQKVNLYVLSPPVEFHFFTQLL